MQWWRVTVLSIVDAWYRKWNRQHDLFLWVIMQIPPPRSQYTSRVHDRSESKITTFQDMIEHISQKICIYKLVSSYLNLPNMPAYKLCKSSITFVYYNTWMLAGVIFWLYNNKNNCLKRLNMIHMFADHEWVILQPETLLNSQTCLRCKQGKDLFDLFQPADWYCAAKLKSR